MTKKNRTGTSASGRDKPGRGKTVSPEQVRKAAVIYMALPLACFFAFFLRWYFSLLCCAALCAVAGYTLKQTRGEKAQPGKGGPRIDSSPEGMLFPVKTVLIAFAVSLLWSYLGGMNGFYYQSADWSHRNAVYFDLIRYDWPVIYGESGAALVYYIGHWLPPAALAKVFQTLLGSQEAGRMAGRILLWLWSSLGLTIIQLMIFRFLGAAEKRQRALATLLLICFSGMDVIGAVFTGKLGRLTDPATVGPSNLHLEHWCSGYQFSSITTCLFWVFNQAIIPWMITLCFLTEEHPRNYVFYCVTCLLCGTLPCVGLAVLMAAKALTWGIKNRKQQGWSGWFQSVFSPGNLLSLLILFPVTAAFMLSANTVTNAVNQSDFFAVTFVSEAEAEAVPAEETIVIPAEEDAWKHIGGRYFNSKLFGFLLMEVGCYMALICSKYRREPLFYVLGMEFLLFPYIHIGASNDFCMRSTVPGIFILMLYVSKYLLDVLPAFSRQSTAEKEGLFREKEGKASPNILRSKRDRLPEKTLNVWKRAAAVLLIICLAVGAATPAMEFYRGFYHVFSSGTVLLENHNINDTLAERLPDNFICSYPDQHFFFRYFARR